MFISHFPERLTRELLCSYSHICPHPKHVNIIFNSSANSITPPSDNPPSVAGLSAGLLSTIIVHPLDILKTRLQMLPGRPTKNPFLGTSLRTLTSIIRTERPLALYRGLTPNLLGNSSSWALYFLWYAQAQDLIRSYRRYSPSQPLTTPDYLLASSASGTLTAILTNPLWVVKTRMLSTPASSTGAYPSMLRGLRAIYATEGLRGYFAGLTPALFGVSHGALYFGVYEKLKAWRRDVNVRSDGEGALGNVDGRLSNLDTLLTSSLAKIVAGTATYPHQLVRTRMQNYGTDSSAAAAASSSSSSGSSKAKLGMIATVRNIWREEGLMAFYKGLGPNLVRVVPSTCVTFLVYENVRVGLPRVWGGETIGESV